MIEQRGVDVATFMQQLAVLRPGELRQQRPDWADRLPHLRKRRDALAKDVGIAWHWSELVPNVVRERYDLWRMTRRYRLNVEQISIDEVDDLAAADDTYPEQLTAVRAHHNERRETARYLLAVAQRRQLERIARRWDVDLPFIAGRGVFDEAAMQRSRRAIREARWTFLERCAKLVPVVSLLGAAIVWLLSRIW